MTEKNEDTEKKTPLSQSAVEGLVICALVVSGDCTDKATTCHHGVEHRKGWPCDLSGCQGHEDIVCVEIASTKESK